MSAGDQPANPGDRVDALLDQHTVDFAQVLGNPRLEVILSLDTAAQLRGAFDGDTQDVLEQLLTVLLVRLGRAGTGS